TTLPMSQSQYGASVGGPLVRDRTFFFTNFEQRRLDQSGLVTIAPAAVDLINARLAAVGYAGAAVATGEYANPLDTTNLLAKLDHQFQGGDLLTLREGLYLVDSSNSRGVGGLIAPSGSAGLDNVDQTFAVSNTAMLSS